MRYCLFMEPETDAAERWRTALHEAGHAVAGTVLTGTAPAFAVDGLYSTTQSQGSTVINANIGNLVKISNIDDPITLLPDAATMRRVFTLIEELCAEQAQGSRRISRA